jgi:prophage antirepressor-like protein
MNEVKVFSFETGAVRTVEQNGEIFFVGKDVCKRLGYTNARKTMNDHCKGVTICYPLCTAGGTQKVRIISESDVMRLICSSKLPEAVKFEKWIFEEVLPSIRKHGGYLTPEKVEEALLNPDVIIRLATELKEERQKRILAEKTKAHIADKKTATALATASAAVRQLNKIKDEIGNGKHYKRVTCIYWLPKYFVNNYSTWVAIGKYLMKLSVSMGKNPIYVPDERYDKVRAYHTSVIDFFHEQIKNDPFFCILTEYRKKIITQK